MRVPDTPSIPSSRPGAATSGAERARSEVGQRVLDAVEEYFPEQARERRRRLTTRAFLAGLLLGLVLGRLGRRRGGPGE